MRTENTEEHGDHIVGMPIVFGQRTNLGYFDEVIDQHALDNTDLRDVRFLVNHDTSKIPLARSRNNNANSTMQMEVTKEGMNIRVDLDTENNSEARNLYSAIKRGDISGMSFAFLVDGDAWEDLESDHPLRTITSISRVFEVSAVTFPAYEATSISARDDLAALESARSALESAQRAEKLEKLRNKLKEVRNAD
jgi:HK97 family phage prohead protease